MKRILTYLMHPSRIETDLDTWLITRDVSFREFRKRIEEKYGIEDNDEKFPRYKDYVSSILMVDALEKALDSTGIEFHEDLSLLDVGAGDWHYANALYDFFSQRNKGKVHMTRIDALKKHQRTAGSLIQGIDAEYKVQDVLKIDDSEKYGVVFMAHMCVSSHHFRQFGLPPYDIKSVMGKSFELVKEGGLFIGFAYAAVLADEGGVFYYLPKENIIYDELYKSEFGRVTDKLSAYYTFDYNHLILAKK